MIRITDPAICPMCISETGYMKRTWDHQFVTTCTTHKVMLLKVCPDCLSPISWDRKRLNQCDCGYSYNKAQLSPAAPACTTATGVVETILNNCDQASYDVLIDFLGTLKLYYRAESILDNDLIVLATTGLLKPDVLERNLYLEIMSDIEVAHYHPRITMSDFLISMSVQVQNVGMNIVDWIFNSGITIDKEIDPKDCISIKSAAKSLGVTTKDVLLLNRKMVLTGYKEKPSSTWLISKKSIHELFIKLDSLSVSATGKPLTTIKNLAEDPQNEHSITTLIIKILNKEIASVSFDFRDLLSSLKVIKPPLVKIPLKKIIDLVTPHHLAEFCGAPLNTIRTAFQASGAFSYFKDGHTSGSQRYIQPHDALRFAELYIPKIRNRQKRTLLQNHPPRPIKTAAVVVTYLN